MQDKNVIHQSERQQMNNLYPEMVVQFRNFNSNLTRAPNIGETISQFDLLVGSDSVRLGSTREGAWCFLSYGQSDEPLVVWACSHLYNLHAMKL